ncbi:hypothetical protein GQ457_01G004100 [Hibiscus cannabinus]
MFENEFDYDHVLEGGPWTIFGSYLTVQPWSREFSTSESFPAQVMVWVRIPGLPYRYYSKALFRHIAAAIGKVVKIDYNTRMGDRGRFARLAVMVSLSAPLVSGIKIDGTIYHLEYEGLQRICFSCGKYGHSKELCRADQVAEVPPSDSLQAPGSSEDNNMFVRIEKEVYGPWMLAPSKRRQPRKDTTRSKGPSSLPGSSGGSRFAILEDNVETELAPSDGRMGLVPEARPRVAELQSDSGVVTDLSAIRGVAIGSRSVPGTIVSHEVAVGLAQRVQVVDSDGSQAPRVESHVVQNVAGNHSAISIIDVANEKR